MTTAELFNDVLKTAIADLTSKTAAIFTFAFYHDRESQAVAVFADTEKNSRKKFYASNVYCVQRFMREIVAGELETAALWNANIVSNISIGDFQYRHVARTEVEELIVDSDFHLTMTRSIIAAQDKVITLAPQTEQLLFVCSTAGDEVGLAWSLPMMSA